MILPILLALSTVFSPSDSTWGLVALSSVSDRALLFAELAAREGGQSTVDYGLLLETAGRFPQAQVAYSVARGWSTDPDLTVWLTARICGTAELDTLIVLTVVLRNPGPGRVEDVVVEVPRPLPHPPFQQLGLFQWRFMDEDGSLICRLDGIDPDSTVNIPLILHLRQVPHTFRPIEDLLADDGISLRQVVQAIRSIPVVESPGSGGPCLRAAMDLAAMLHTMGSEAEVTGGLLRPSPDSLVFHAWNTLSGSGLPMDAVLFAVDSLRGIGHLPTDMIPLWDLGATGGHEVSVYFTGSPEGLEVGMNADFLDMALLTGVLAAVPLPIFRSGLQGGLFR